MSSLSFEVLNLTDENEVVAYERALYRAFAATDLPTLADVWVADHRQKRLRKKIPYTSQEVYAVKLHGAILSAVAINYDMTSRLQLEMLGFTVDKTEPHVAEGIGLFNLSTFTGDATVAASHKDFVLKKLAQKKIQKVYGTCTHRRRTGYSMLGFEFLDERDFNGEHMHLMVIRVKSD